MGKEVLFGFELIDLYSIARCIHYIRQTWVSMIKNRDERDDVCSWRNGRLTLDITIEAWRKKLLIGGVMGQHPVTSGIPF